MGMFDNIICKKELPLTEELLKLSINWTDRDFQTKDLDCSLACYYINEKGLLEEEVVEREYIKYTEEEIQSQNISPWSVYKEIIEKNRYLKPISHHGVINFYDSIPINEKQDLWIEFKAYFIYGKLDKIELFQSEIKESYSISYLQWQKKQEQEEKRPLNRLRNILRYVGWRKFWNSVAKCSYSTNNFYVKYKRFVIKYNDKKTTTVRRSLYTIYSRRTC